MQNPSTPRGARGVSRRGFFGRLTAGCLVATAAAARPASAARQGPGTAAGGAAVDAITNVRLRGKAGLWSVGIKSGRISEISQQVIGGSNAVAGNGRLLTEGLVEHHIHLDKVFTAARFKWNDGGLAEDRDAYQKDISAGKMLRRSFGVWRENQVRHTYTEEDVFQRAMKVVRMESANGTTAMRTHCVVDAVRDVKGLQGLLRLRDAIKPYMDLQISLHAQDSLILHDPGEAALLKRGLELGADGVGATIEVEPDRIDDFLEALFRVAKEQGKFVDVHDQARETPFSPPILAAKARKHGMEGKVTCSHGFSLGHQPREKLVSVFDEMKSAGVALACAPTGTVQERIGIPRSRGVDVSLITDNVGDSIIRASTADLVLTSWLAMRLLGTQSDESLEGVFNMITTCPAKSMAIDGYGLRVGGRADLVLWEAESAPQIVVEQSERALVLKNGTVVARDGRALW